MNQKQIGGFVAKQKLAHEEELKVKRYDATTLGVLKEQDWLPRYAQDLHCDCPLIESRTLGSFKTQFTHELNGNYNPILLNSADKVHELIAGSKEFNVSREAIKSDDLKTYFSQKEYA